MSNPIAGTAGKLFVANVKLDRVLVTTADSTSWAVTEEDGTAVSSGTLTYVDPLPVDGFTQFGGWYANIIWPAAATYNVNLIITKSSAPMEWYRVVTVEEYPPIG